MCIDYVGPAVSMSGEELCWWMHQCIICLSIQAYICVLVHLLNVLFHTMCVHVYKYNAFVRKCVLQGEN